MSTQNTLAVCFYARGLKTWGSIMLGASPRIPMARQPHAIPRHCCSRRASRLGAQAIRQCHLLGPQCRCHLSTGRPRLGSCRQTDCILATYEADPKPSEMQTTFEAMQQKGGRCPWVCPSSRWSSADPKLKLRSDTDPLRPHAKTRTQTLGLPSCTAPPPRKSCPSLSFQHGGLRCHAQLVIRKVVLKVRLCTPRRKMPKAGTQTDGPASCRSDSREGAAWRCSPSREGCWCFCSRAAEVHTLARARPRGC